MEMRTSCWEQMTRGLHQRPKSPSIPARRRNQTSNSSPFPVPNISLSLSLSRRLLSAGKRIPSHLARLSLGTRHKCHPANSQLGTHTHKWTTKKKEFYVPDDKQVTRITRHKRRRESMGFFIFFFLSFLTGAGSGGSIHP